MTNTIRETAPQKYSKRKNWLCNILVLYVCS